MKNEKVIYLYDGTFEGFLCCVYNYYYNRLKPVDIQPRADYMPSFYQAVDIDTDFEQTYRVSCAIGEKMGYDNLAFLKESMLCACAGKEMKMLEYVKIGLKKGAKVSAYYSSEDVSRLLKAHRRLVREARLYMGIVRFYKSGQIYVSVIEPKNRVLAVIARHFCERFSDQRFIIYDKTHSQALISAGGKGRLIDAGGIDLPPRSPEEASTRRLWKTFYDTVAIKERNNPRCRMNFMPKRVWNHLTEMEPGEEKQEKNFYLTIDKQ